MDPQLVRIAIGGLAVLGVIGIVFGIGLALAAHRFHVEVDPKVEAVKEILAGANCGGCGFAGCEGYAEAVVNDLNVPPNLCYPGGEEVARMVAEITGKKVEAVEQMIAITRCSKIEGRVKQKHQYIGHPSCVAVNIAFGGIMTCNYACIGLGDCATVCPFDAITIVGGSPRIDPLKCVGCGTCAKVCPKKIIEVIPRNARVWVPCSSKDPGKVVRKICEAGCIFCKICIKTCPAKAISVEDGIIKIDHKRCLEYAEKCEEVCVEKCPRNILRQFKIIYEYQIEKKAA